MSREAGTSAEKVKRSTRVYDTSALNLYDVFVHGFCNRFAWHCPTDVLLDQYRTHVRASHLEVGVGTGYLLDRCTIRAENPRVGLMDFSQQCLDESSRRLARYRPELYRHNILEPFTRQIARFDSIGLNYVLHCVPGTFKEKGVAFSNLKALLNDGGMLFGSTLLGSGVPRNGIARALMGVYNRLGLFNNRDDCAGDLEGALKKYFASVRVELVGCCALFSAT